MLRKHMSTFTGAHYFPFIKKIATIGSILLLLFFLLYFMIGLNDSVPETQTGEQVRFTIADGRSQQMFYTRNMDSGEQFILEYTHSVTNQPVQEFYRINNQQQIEIYEMRFDEFGANLPVGPEQVDGIWTEFIVTDEYYIIKYQKRVFDRVPLQVGKVIANHTLVFSDGERLVLQDILRDTSFIEMYVTY